MSTDPTPTPPPTAAETLPDRLEPEDLAHLRGLIAAWGALADLCFADLLLFVPEHPGDPAMLLVVGQIRPTTNPTLYREDMVGRVFRDDERPTVATALRTGMVVEGQAQPAGGERARVQAIPVRRAGRVLGVMTRESAPTVGRRQGELERVYVETFDRFVRMIVNGEFPFGGGDDWGGEAPRVGDGVLLADDGGRIVYGSPNAVSALHRMGVTSNIEGAKLAELGVDSHSVGRALKARVPVTEEVERRPDMSVLVRAIPLLEEGVATGAIVLVRDVTDLRRRDRLLVSKDATIREVHHRVKNNLQTISSLLRLQARRLGSEEGRVALEEAERRIRAIALVHETLSRDPGDQVALSEIVRSLTHMAEDAAVSYGGAVRIELAGDAGEVPNGVATPLAVVIAELLQNAVEHAFTGPGPWERDGRHVGIRFENDGQEMTVTVWDNGAGLPPDFDLGTTTSLGMSLVRDLVTGQLSGQIRAEAEEGTQVWLHIPLPEPEGLA